MSKSLTLVLSTGTYLNEAPTSVLRLAEKAVTKGYDVNVWAFEEAVTLSNKDQIEHREPAAVEKVIGETHPTYANALEPLLKKGVHTPKFDWVSCVLCVQERGVEKHQMQGVTIGTLGDVWKYVKESDRAVFVPAYR
ncbi:MAG: DsrE family protein [Candidatus Bathyarchaeia archaeon]